MSGSWKETAAALHLRQEMSATHSGCRSLLEWCDESGVDFVFGLSGNGVLDRLAMKPPMTFALAGRSTRNPVYAASPRPATGRNPGTRSAAPALGSEPTTKGLDIRFVVTSIETGSAEHIYETLYCARGQAENLIKLHKAQLASDRTSCRSPLANQAPDNSQEAFIRKYMGKKREPLPLLPNLGRYTREGEP